METDDIGPGRREDVSGEEGKRKGEGQRRGIVVTGTWVKLTRTSPTSTYLPLSAFGADLFAIPVERSHKTQLQIPLQLVLHRRRQSVEVFFSPALVRLAVSPVQS